MTLYWYPPPNVDQAAAFSVAVVMATRSYREGKKMRWDRKVEAIDG
jgi:hypothetical protein